MAPMPLLCFISSLWFLSLAHAQDSTGLSQENPILLSPSAFDFFHPKSTLSSSKIPCAPLPLSSLSSASSTNAQVNQVYEGEQLASKVSGTRVGVGGIVGIVFAFVFAALLAMGVYHVVITRRANIKKANTVELDV